MTHVHQALRASGHQASVSKVCDWFDLSRSTAYHQPRETKPRPIDEALAARIKQLHKQEPACGVRGTWSRLRFIEDIPVNRKKVHRIMKLRGWTLPKRKAGARPRVRVSRSIADHPDQRWATDLALIHCGKDGWCVFVPVIDCCTREVLGMQPDEAKKHLKLLVLTCGNKDGLINISQGMHAYLKEHQMLHTWHVDGHGHDAAHWGSSVYCFGQKIFR